MCLDGDSIQGITSTVPSTLSHCPLEKSNRQKAPINIQEVWAEAEWDIQNMTRILHTVDLMAKNTRQAVALPFSYNIY